MRIQPREIETPEGAPFQHDQLDRKETIEVLSRVIGSVEGPFVLAIDAPWGNGKTTFINMWDQFLRDEGFPVAKFNAWETDYAANPLLAISTELTEAMRVHQDASTTKQIDRAIDETKVILRRMFPGVLKALVAQVPGAGPILEEASDTIAETFADEPLSEYKETKESIEKFRIVLAEMAESLSESRDGKPLVLMIDELDRCRPSYAVELLEVAKHIFSVDNITFVLAVNRTELAHSICALYGDEFDASGYLRRFFDVEIRLPEPDRSSFISATIESAGIRRYARRLQSQDVVNDISTLERMLQSFFSSPSLTLRTVEHAIHQLGLVYASLPDDRRPLAIPAAVALIVRTADLDLYRRFLCGDASDLDVANAISGLLYAREPSDVQEHASWLFEACLIVAHMERDDPIAFRMGRMSGTTPLRNQYRGSVENLEDGGRTPPTPGEEHARGVLRRLDDFLEERRFLGGSMGFKSAVDRIELLSTELLSLG